MLDLTSQVVNLVAAATGAAGGVAQDAGGLAPRSTGFLFLIPLFPALGSLVNLAIGWRLQRTVGKQAVHAVAVGAMVLSWLVAVVAFVTLLAGDFHHTYLHQRLWTLLDTGNGFVANIAFSLDTLSMTMVLIVTTIGTLIHVYSIGYMADEPAYWRFFCFLNFFCFSMLLLVMGDNFALMFFGWEGVGLASYLLIGFWYGEVKNAVAGNKAFIVNRIGDFGFIVGIFLLFWVLAGSWGDVPGAFPTLDFNELRHQFVDLHVGGVLADRQLLGIPVLLIIGFCLFVGAAGKSAQIPLHTWLPDAMAGPTPVSALIHAATMVTAGVYMVARLNFLYAFTPGAMTVVALVGAVTALFAATIGFFQYDIKKVLAYSTVSQLGFMFVGVGAGAWWAGIYHLFTHACFKACLFLGAGSVILACHHEQDMRKMGGLKKLLPLTERTWWYACVCITAAPIFLFGNGFYSKDEILWKAFSAGSNLVIPGASVFWIALVAAAGTSFYMWRSYYMTFTGEYRGGHAPAEGHAPAAAHGSHPAHGAADAHGHGGPPKESPRTMTWVLVALSGLAVFSILVGLWPLLGHLAAPLAAPLFERWLHPSLPTMSIVESRALFRPGEAPFWLEGGLAALSVGLALVSYGFARWLYQGGRNPAPARLMARFPRIHRVVFNKYYVDEIYQGTVVRPVMISAAVSNAFDKYVIDGLVNLAGAIVRFGAAIDGWIDKYLVDGMVNLVADVVIALGRRVQRVQTGRIQTYLYGAVVGALVFVGINYLLR